MTTSPSYTDELAVQCSMKEREPRSRWRRIRRLVAVAAVLGAIAVPVSGLVFIEHAMAAATATGGCGGG
jgi:uncharacterized membrane protein YkgB